MRTILIAMTLFVIAPGCQTIDKPSVIAASGTTIGLEVGQNGASGSPELVFGYNRAEIAVVSEEQIRREAQTTDVPNVVMELRYSSAANNAPGVYQRLAVGSDAVRHAEAMFLRDSNGQISPESLAAADRLAERHGVESSFDSPELDP